MQNSSNNQRVIKKSTKELYNVEVSQEGMQELNPLVPHQSSISLKFRDQPVHTGGLRQQQQFSLRTSVTSKNQIKKQANENPSQSKLFQKLIFGSKHKNDMISKSPLAVQAAEPQVTATNDISFGLMGALSFPDSLHSLSSKQQFQAQSSSQPASGIQNLRQQLNMNASSRTPIFGKTRPEMRQQSKNYLVKNTKRPSQLAVIKEARDYPPEGKQPASSGNPNSSKLLDILKSNKPTNHTKKTCIQNMQEQKITPKQHYLYYVDTDDILKILECTEQHIRENLLHFQCSGFLRKKTMEEKQSTDGKNLVTRRHGGGGTFYGSGTARDMIVKQVMSERRRNSEELLETSQDIVVPRQNQSVLSQEVAGGDQDALELIAMVEFQSKKTVQQFLLINKGHFRVYKVEDDSVLTAVFYQRNQEQVLVAVQEMHKALTQYISKKLKGRKSTTRLGFDKEQQLYNLFKMIFGDKTFQDQDLTSRRIMQSLWESFQLFRYVTPNNQAVKKGSTTAHKGSGDSSNVLSALGLDKPSKSVTDAQLENYQIHLRAVQAQFKSYPVSTLQAYVSLSLLLYCHGKALFYSEKKEFVLHKAVFEGNLPQVSRLANGQQDGIIFCDKNELDQCGNTPLSLAIKVKNLDAVKILTDLHCSTKLNPLPQIVSALELAKAQKDRNLIEILMESELKLKQHYLKLHKEEIFRVLEKLPNFNIDLHFNCTSSVLPNLFTANFTPSDTYKIYKQGSNLRLDMRLIGIKKLGQGIRGNLSVLFKGRGSGKNEGELLVVDHEHNTVTSIFEDATLNRLERDLDNIMKDEQYQKQFKTERFQIELDTDRHGAAVVQEIQGLSAYRHSVLTIYTMTKFRLNMKQIDVQYFRRFKTFEDYMRANKINIVQIGTSPANNIGGADKSRDLPFFEPVQQTGQATSRIVSSGNPFNQPQSSYDPNPLLTQDDLEQHTTCKCNNITNQMGSDPFLSLTTRKEPCSCNMASSLNVNVITQKHTRKTISASIWLANDYPLSIDSFLPLLHVLSFSSKQVRKLSKYLTNYQLPGDKFPLRAKIPLVLTMEATFSFQNLTFTHDSKQEHANTFLANSVFQDAEQVFQIDERVEKLRKAEMEQHYRNLQNQNTKLISHNTEEDAAKHQVTLTRLYKQLKNKGRDETELDGDEEDSAEDFSIREDSRNCQNFEEEENLEEKYRRMLEEANEEDEQSSQMAGSLRPEEHRQDFNSQSRSGAPTPAEDAQPLSSHYHPHKQQALKNYKQLSDLNESVDQFEKPLTLDLVERGQGSFHGTTNRLLGEIKTMNSINLKHDVGHNAHPADANPYHDSSSQHMVVTLQSKNTTWKTSNIEENVQQQRPSSTKANSAKLQPFSKTGVTDEQYMKNLQKMGDLNIVENQLFKQAANRMVAQKTGPQLNKDIDFAYGTADIHTAHRKQADSILSPKNTAGKSLLSTLIKKAGGTDTQKVPPKEKLEQIDRASRIPLPYAFGANGPTDIDPSLSEAGLGFSQQTNSSIGMTSLEKRNRRKEMIRLYKQRKELAADEKQKPLFVSGNFIEHKNQSQYQQALAHARPSNVSALQAKIIAAENIIDSRAMEIRPLVNTTIEKKKFINSNIHQAVIGKSLSAVTSSNNPNVSIDIDGATPSVTIEKQTTPVMREMALWPHQRMHKTTGRETPSISAFNSAKQSPVVKNLSRLDQKELKRQASGGAQGGGNSTAEDSKNNNKSASVGLSSGSTTSNPLSHSSKPARFNATLLEASNLNSSTIAGEVPIEKQSLNDNMNNRSGISSKSRSTPSDSTSSMQNQKRQHLTLSSLMTHNKNPQFLPNSPQQRAARSSNSQNSNTDKTQSLLQNSQSSNYAGQHNPYGSYNQRSSRPQSYSGLKEHPAHMSHHLQYLQTIKSEEEQDASQSQTMGALSLYEQP